MKTPKPVVKACQALRSYLDFEDAHFTLPLSPAGEDDTEEVLEATDLYFRTWIHPIVNAIELGDFEEIKRLCKHARKKEIPEEDFEDEPTEEDPW